MWSRANFFKIKDPRITTDSVNIFKLPLDHAAMSLENSWPASYIFIIRKVGKYDSANKTIILNSKIIVRSNAVSYTHLTLPTNREV